MSSVKKIARTSKTKTAPAKSKAAKSTAARSRSTKRGSEPVVKNARATTSRTASARAKVKHAPAKAAPVKKAAKTAVAKTTAAKTKAPAKTRTAAQSARTVRVAVKKPAAKSVRTTRAAASAASAKAAAAKRKSAVAKTAKAATARAPAPTRKTKARTPVQAVPAKKPVAATSAAIRNVKAKQTESVKLPKSSNETAGASPANLGNVEAIRTAKQAAPQRATPVEGLPSRPAQQVQAVAERGSLPGVAGVQSQTADAKIETSNPVTQKIQKNASDATAVAGSGKATSVKSSDTASKEPTSAAAPRAEGGESRPAEPRPAESRPVESRPQDRPGAAAKMVKPGTPKQNFKASEFVVYPAHGVGQIVAIEEQEVAGFKLELFVISFIKDKMILKVPTPKSVSVGMRKLATPETVKRALHTLTGRARIKRTMWSRRAQEYEAKINSGDLVAIAEVVRDLYRSDAQPEQSYSERQLYEAALDRVAREIAVVQKLTETESLKLIESQLQKSPRRGKAEDADPADAEDGDVEEAA